MITLSLPDTFLFREHQTGKPEGDRKVGTLAVAFLPFFSLLCIKISGKGGDYPGYTFSVTPVALTVTTSEMFVVE